MSEIAALMGRVAAREGTTETGVPGVRLHRRSADIARVPLLYQQGVVIVGQGTKKVHLGETVHVYDPDHYLVLSVPLPAECEAVVAPGEALLSMAVDIDLRVLGDIIERMDDPAGNACLKAGARHQGLAVARADAAFKETVVRLLRALLSPRESRVLGPGLVRELLFRIMCGENAASLHALAVKNTGISRVEKALKHIHCNFYQPCNVEQLAGSVNMSTSAFHRAFKDVTSLSPIQYLKKVRLNKAKSLLAEDGLRASDAARQVGYESVSQFTREFKRYFGASPTSCRR
ncbi:transcriptional regulator, AraC family [Solidesulfovibrio carbinoliphilus subsp. oakridgensis]|uniref:Transcriptional regulator, AraC family n=1 Tax=Solidesulfovibrio carbinoliphilus subsp. oakridgensis TaxID=694327 RepID=G7QBP7_9BACT|nr:AraC family transcriptional regulator [Solidesulfovibrio carbinoliphilus]EHJ48910.1 transcriptional regulator, AraC family [Solidesulfovibrio carbinoliphilus subsp. oakridgensis]